jgi:hypothetical protein
MVLRRALAALALVSTVTAGVVTETARLPRSARSSSFESHQGWVVGTWLGNRRELAADAMLPSVQTGWCAPVCP